MVLMVHKMPLKKIFYFKNKFFFFYYIVVEHLEQLVDMLLQQLDFEL
jgi:hypothetical protein